MVSSIQILFIKKRKKKKEQRRKGRTGERGNFEN